MAIGSEGEIGVTFGNRSSFDSNEAYWEWFRVWREYVGDDLLGEYATLAYPNRNRSE
jgi:hypothetical protein